MGVPIRDFLKARRDRALGTILGHAERSIYARLTPEQQKEFRAIVVEALNSYHDVTLDLLKSDDSARNEEILALMRRVDGHLDGRRKVPTHGS